MDTAFIDELASGAPTPGGGGASAYVGALSAAAACMVGNFTVGKKTYAEVEDQVKLSIERLQGLKDYLVDLVNQDAQAFGPLSDAYRLPKDTEEQKAAKHKALQSALYAACDVPMNIMRAVADVLDEIDFVAHHGSKMVRSDAGVAAAFARAASDAASLNVFINIASMEDEQAVMRYRGEAEMLADRTRERADELFNYVKTAVS